MLLTILAFSTFLFPHLSFIITYQRCNSDKNVYDDDKGERSNN